MNKIILCVATICLMILSCARTEAFWRLEGMNFLELPRNFRLTTDSIQGEFSIKGFSELQASGSGQPNLPSLYILYENLREHAKADAKIYLIDLRQEPHGFVDGYPVSWYVDKNRANYYRGNDGIEEDELERLNTLRGKSAKFVPIGKFDTEHFKPIEFVVNDTQTERQAATSAGFEYIRLGVTDMMFPAPDVVDDFYSFLNVVDKDAWLHFHSQAGEGRTTIFMIMYDMVMNPDVSFDDVIARQNFIGKTTLLKDNDIINRLGLFYRYVQGQHSGSVTSTWNEFLIEEEMF